MITNQLEIRCGLFLTHHQNKTVSNPKHYRDGFKTQELTINGLAEAVKRGHAWSCATYDHSMRSKANYQQAQLIGLDIDNGLTLNDALKHPFVKQYGQLIYTSASHQKPKGNKGTRGQGDTGTGRQPDLTQYCLVNKVIHPPDICQFMANFRTIGGNFGKLVHIYS